MKEQAAFTGNNLSGNLLLFVYIDAYAGLEFHGKFILIDGDFLNQPFDQSLVKFSEFGRLSGDEVLQYPDAA